MGMSQTDIQDVSVESANEIHTLSRRLQPAMLLLFVGSGCAALIYEIVWLQLLQLVIGSSAVSLGVLLGTFMGGMCLGSLLLPRLVSRRRHPLRVYATMEIGIGIIGIAVLFAMPYVTRIYVEHLGQGMPSILLRAAVAAMCLLLPTILMGATLPAIARYVEATPTGVSWLGLFYAGNIAGAVCGCLLAGFYLLPVYDMHTATFVAAAINFGVAIVALLLARPDYQPAWESGSLEEGAEPQRDWPIYLAILLSGLTGLGCEVVWTRLLSLMLGATVYTFSIILAMFLIGLGIGSSIGAYVARTSQRPRIALAICQLLLAGAMAWAACVLAKSLPYWPIDPHLSVNPWFMFQLDILRSAWVVMPGALLWGASFPLALAAATRPGQDTGRVVGGVYAANTLGAIVGSLLVSIVIIPLMGTQHAQQILIGCSILSGLIALLQTMTSIPRGAAIIMLIVVTLIGASVTIKVPAMPGLAIAYGRYLPARKLKVADDGSIEDRVAKLLYAGEGLNSSVAVTQLPNGHRSFHISGRIEASTLPEDMRVQRMLGHVPALLHPKPKTVLVVGCGAGVTAGSFICYPDVERIVICELEPLIPQVVTQYFSEVNYDVVKDITPKVSSHEINGKRIEVIYDDARHYVATTKEKFDIITSDPIHPWIKGSATLYTKEYFEFCKQHLNPGGIVTQWVPLYESTPDVIKSECATFFQAFPDGMIWGNQQDGRGYDVVFTGSVEPMKIDVSAMRLKLAQPEYYPVAASLRQVGFNSYFDLLCTYAGRGSELKQWTAGAQINTDRNLRLQYLAGMAFNAEQAGGIYDSMLEYRKFPEGIMVGDAEQLDPLRMVLVPMRGSGQ
jgi:spermidine synthase